MLYSAEAETMKTQATAEGYTCGADNPCGKGGEYYPHVISSKFIHCAASGELCYEKNCPGGLQWDQTQLFCVYPWLPATAVELGF